MKAVPSALMLLGSFVCLLLAAGVAAQDFDSDSYRLPKLKSDMLKSHNRYRREHRVDDLRWHSGAADHAQHHANKCVFEHSSDENDYGENIAAGYVTSIKSVEGWGDERVLYNFKNGGFSKDTGHFTQMVWKDTYGVGCGAALCPGIISSGVKQWFLVCNYIEAGNVEGEYRENVLTPI